jgi:pimeloyl-ACP methyl ester carboxylesterase
VTPAGQDLWFESSDRRLAGRAFGLSDDVAAASRPGILFVHGSGSDQSGFRPRAEAVVEATSGIALTFDLAGHGKSSDRGIPLTPVSWSDHRLDALAAFDQLVSFPAVDPIRVGVCGASYGGYLAASLVSQRKIARLLLRAPALGEDGLPPSELRAFRGPVLIVESGRDAVIPHTTIEAYLEACGGRAQHVVMPSAGHALTEPAWKQGFIDLIVEWSKDL